MFPVAAKTYPREGIEENVDRVVDITWHKFIHVLNFKAKITLKSSL